MAGDGVGLFGSMHETACVVATRPTQIREQVRARNVCTHVCESVCLCVQYIVDIEPVCARRSVCNTFTDLMQICGRCHRLLKDMPDK